MNTGVQVKLWDPLRTRAIHERFELCSRQGATQIHVTLLTLPYLIHSSWSVHCRVVSSELLQRLNCQCTRRHRLLASRTVRKVSVSVVSRTKKNPTQQLRFQAAKSRLHLDSASPPRGVSKCFMNKARIILTIRLRLIIGPKHWDLYIRPTFRPT